MPVGKLFLRPFIITCVHSWIFIGRLKSWTMHVCLKVYFLFLFYAKIVNFKHLSTITILIVYFMNNLYCYEKQKTFFCFYLFLIIVFSLQSILHFGLDVAFSHICFLSSGLIYYVYPSLDWHVRFDLHHVYPSLDWHFRFDLHHVYPSLDWHVRFDGSVGQISNSCISQFIYTSETYVTHWFFSIRWCHWSPLYISGFDQKV